MAKRTANTGSTAKTQVSTTDSARFTITGKLDSVYVGKKYAYATVHVKKANGYYDAYKVQCSLEYDFPDDGQQITITGSISKYKDECNFIADDVSNN